MPNYKESSVTGTIWPRCYQVVLGNPRPAAPSVRFDEESILVLSDGTELHRPIGALAVVFDPAKEIALRNPITDELTGMSMNYGEIYAVIYSAYRAAALERDTPPINPDTPL